MTMPNAFEDLMKNIFREVLDEKLNTLAEQTAEETVSKIKGHKRRRDELDTLEKQLQEKEEQLQKKEQQFDDIEKDLEQQQQQLKKQKNAIASILEDKNGIKYTLEFLVKKEELLKQKDPKLFEEYTSETNKLAQHYSKLNECDEEPLNFGNEYATSLVEITNKAEDIIYGKESVEKDENDDKRYLNLSLSLSEEELPVFTYRPPQASQLK